MSVRGAGREGCSVRVGRSGSVGVEGESMGVQVGGETSWQLREKISLETEAGGAGSGTGQQGAEQNSGGLEGPRENA